MCSPIDTYQVEIARTVGAVEALREAWERTPSRIEADIDFFLQFVKTHRYFVLRPHVIVLKKGTQVIAILPGRLERQRPKIRLGYTHFTLPELDQITFIGQLLGENSADVALEIVNSAQMSLEQKEADAALFHQVDSQESLSEIVAGAGGLLTKDYFKQSEQNWRTQIPNSYDAFLARRSNNTRHNIRRYSKRLLQAFPGNVKHKVLRDPTEIPTILRDCETVAAATYQRGLEIGFFDNEETRQSFSLAAARGWLRSYILYTDGRPSAFWNGFLYRTSFLTWNTAYDPRLSELRPGLYLLQKLVEDLCANGSVCELDFGTGVAQYKRDMSDRCALRVSMFVFAPTLRGVYINVLRTLSLGVLHAAKWVLVRAGYLEKVKRLWRSRAAQARS